MPGFLRRAPLMTAIAVVMIGSTIAEYAEADVHLDGRYRQSALREDFTVQQWLAGCGPPPQSSSTGGGEVVTVRAEGDELAFVGGGRVYRSNQCYDPMPTLARETHSRDANGKTWRTRCTTPPNDPRKAILNTLVVATTDTHIDVVETGRYEVALESGRCMADVKRTRSYELIVDDKPAASAAPPPDPATTAKAPSTPNREPPVRTCESTGAPQRLEVRPSHKLLRTGESFVFRPVVLDEKGCATKTSTSWALAPDAQGKGVSVDAKGTVSVDKDAPEGSVEIVATAAGKSTRVVIDVTQPAHYDDLLARSGLNASGENDTASTVSIASESIGAGESRVEDHARARRLSFIAIVAGALAVLAIAFFILRRRSQRASGLAKIAEERHESRVREVLERRRARAEEHAAQQRAHEESVAAFEAAKKAARSSTRNLGNTPPAPEAASEPELACPTCGRTFGQKLSFCPHDGARLALPTTPPGPAISAGAGVAAKNVAAKRGKICPTCGDRFEGPADYCGKDGTQLVLLN